MDTQDDAITTDTPQDTMEHLISRVRRARSHLTVAMEVAARVHPSNTAMEIPDHKVLFRLNAAHSEVTSVLEVIDPEFETYAKRGTEVKLGPDKLT